ncbi:MAG TPA: DUF2071 domain-containing protein [Cyclobacteriaceae bacterium]
MKNPFLTAEWRKLTLFNYSIDPEILLPHLPYKTELDYWNNTCYVSLVGFMFLNTKLKGIRIPFHSDFEEVNLRFYVRYKDEITNEWKRGVVFIKEIVPKPALTFVANTLYKEHYHTMPMKHSISSSHADLTVEYAWKSKTWNSIKVRCQPTAENISVGSEAEFITEHFWGYTRIHDSKTSEYNVEHPRWNVYPVLDYNVEVDFTDLYGDDFANLRYEKPKSVFLAEGSEISVGAGRII